MTDRYVDSAAVGANDGTSKTDAFTTLSAALTAAAAGDRIFCSHTHAESNGASITLTSAGTIALYVQIFSVNFTGSTPPVHADITAGAVVATGNGAYIINFVGFAISKGVAYRAGVGSALAGDIRINSSAAADWIFEDCTLELANTNASSRFDFIGASNAAQKATWKNVTLKFGHVSQNIGNVTTYHQWEGGGIDAAGSSPTILFNSTGRNGQIRVEGVDLSHMGSGKTIVGSGHLGSALIRRCKLGASVTRVATPTIHTARHEFRNCNAGDVNYDNSITEYYGEMTTETTIVRTGGASDGTTPIAHKIVTTANAAPETPFRSMPIEFWNETLSAITITIQGIWGGGAVPDDDEIWMEVDYLGTSGFPISTRASDRMASLLSTPAGQAAGSGTWGGSTTKFALSVTITPAEKGLITINIFAGAASGTFYIDPKPVIT